ncbi:MAG: DUF3784 domain-containing protein [Clostridiales bacterium]|nr:DUF3784 domain-containing protein [Clostridiales bacterium]
MADRIVAYALLTVSLLLIIAGSRSWMEKGFLMNNAYLYATKAERETMNKKPYYRQTAVIFFLLSMVFLLLGIAVLLNAGWLTHLAAVCILLAPVYAIISAVGIEKQKKQAEQDSHKGAKP